TIRPPHLLISRAAVLEQPQPAVPATRVSLTLAAAPPAGWQDHFQLRFGALDGGTPTSPAKTRIANDDLGAAAALAGPVEPLGNAPSPISVLAQGAEAAGAEIPGSVGIDGSGNGIFHPAGSAPPFDPRRTPGFGRRQCERELPLWRGRRKAAGRHDHADRASGERASFRG